VLVFVTFDLLAAGWGLNPSAERSIYATGGPTAEAARAAGQGSRLYMPAQVENVLTFERFFTFKSFIRPEPWENIRHMLLPVSTLNEQIPSVNNYDPLQPGRFARWMDALKSGGADLHERLLDRMDVGAIERLDKDQVYGVRIEAHAGASRARLVPCAQFAVDGEAAWNLLTGAKGDPFQQVVIEDRSAGRSENCPESIQSPPGSVYILESRAGRVRVQTESSVTGWLTLADVWYPGWTARLDGQDTSIYRADYLFRAILVPAGKHEIVFEYQPASFRLGVFISAVIWAGMLAAWFYSRLSRGQNMRSLSK
jgi:hypothetical protein